MVSYGLFREGLKTNDIEKGGGGGTVSQKRGKGVRHNFIDKMGHILRERLPNKVHYSEC